DSVSLVKCAAVTRLSAAPAMRTELPSPPRRPTSAESLGGSTRTCDAILGVRSKSGLRDSRRSPTYPDLNLLISRGPKSDGTKNGAWRSGARDGARTTLSADFQRPPDFQRPILARERKRPRADEFLCTPRPGAHTLLANESRPRGAAAAICR